MVDKLVAGVVVLYNSEDEVVENIQTYLPQINHLFIIDNSEKPERTLNERLKQVPKATYVAIGENKGIAFALNTAASLAITAGYAYLLTMDDDTSVPADSINRMVAQMANGNYGIIAGQSDPRKYGSTNAYVEYTITSGSLLNLRAYKECGPFIDDLFIDFVDIEYCFRLSCKGYKVIEMNDIHINHRLGRAKQTNFFFGKLTVNWFTHSPERVYYKIRNCLFTMKSYRDIPLQVRKLFYKDILRELINIILLEDQKIKRSGLFLRAFYDFLAGRMGKI